MRLVATKWKHKHWRRILMACACPLQIYDDNDSMTHRIWIVGHRATAQIHGRFFCFTKNRMELDFRRLLSGALVASVSSTTPTPTNASEKIASYRVVHVFIAFAMWGTYPSKIACVIAFAAKYIDCMCVCMLTDKLNGWTALVFMNVWMCKVMYDSRHIYLNILWMFCVAWRTNQEHM